MYLSRVELNCSKNATRIALGNPQKLHGAIEQSYSGEKTRKLWRIDTLGEKTYLLVLSSEEPDFTQLIDQFGFTNSSWETKSYDALLDRIEKGTVWKFRLKANPVRSIRSDDGARGKVSAHVTPEFERKWIFDRAEKLGFSLKEDEYDIRDRRWYNFNKHRNGCRVSFKAVTFEGILTVTDEELFKRTLLEGVGRDKAYGLGLLTIVRSK